MQKPLTRKQRDGLVLVIDTFFLNAAWDNNTILSLQMLVVIQTIEATLGEMPELTLDRLPTFRDNLATSGVIEDN